MRGREEEEEVLRIFSCVSKASCFFFNLMKFYFKNKQIKGNDKIFLPFFK